MMTSISRPQPPSLSGTYRSPSRLEEASNMATRTQEVSWVGTLTSMWALVRSQVWAGVSTAHGTTSHQVPSSDTECTSPSGLDTGATCSRLPKRMEPARRAV